MSAHNDLVMDIVRQIFEDGALQRRNYRDYRVLLPDEVGFLVDSDGRCYRCGDVNSEDGTCLTCTHPDDPCSRVFIEPGP